MQTCSHFRFQLPREYADDLRDADSEPCAICDSLPHRQSIGREANQNVAEVFHANTQSVETFQETFAPEAYRLSRPAISVWKRLLRACTQPLSLNLRREAART